MNYLEYILGIIRIILMTWVKVIWEILKIFIPLKYQMKDVTGEIALVTGGGGGLGRSIALELSNVGVTVVIWDINENGIEETVKLVQDTGGTCYGYVCNLLKREEIYEKAAQLRKEVGEVSILVNNAGTTNVMTFQDTPDNALLHMIELNLISQYWTVKAFLPSMRRSNKGHIVCIASCSGYLPLPFLVNYTASKNALIGLYEALDLELNLTEKGNKVSITIINPVFIHSTGFKVEEFLSFLPTLSPKEVAMKTVIAMRCNKKNVIIPGYINIFIIIVRIFPWAYTQWLQLIMKNIRIPSYNDKMSG